DLDGGTASSRATAVSRDGLSVVGFSENGDDVEAFLYSQESGMRGLGLLNGKWDTKATDVSHGGERVIGNSNGTGFIFTDRYGLMRLDQYLSEIIGIDMTGWQIFSAQSISDDGLVLTGNGRDPSGLEGGWIAVIPEPSTATLLGIGLLFLASRQNRGLARSSMRRPSRPL